MLSSDPSASVRPCEGGRGCLLHAILPFETFASLAFRYLHAHTIKSNMEPLAISQLGGKRKALDEPFRSLFPQMNALAGSRGLRRRVLLCRASAPHHHIRTQNVPRPLHSIHSVWYEARASVSNRRRWAMKGVHAERLSTNERTMTPRILLIVRRVLAVPVTCPYCNSKVHFYERPRDS